ncbi:hypothetical protein [Candidatus Cryosericum odellii]|uniref:Uncharacterized protein n=1 Tax=Candidatus Cryosericum odellii TaxID=2290917 RepID=A0A398CVN6_9BACT|nr:hypothetical protein [Candidatus Cryosericum odellii]RIE06593.1 hypothetical protein SMC6_08595 [Candidatus Cryosericum odellii]RIE07770.1 hypothetical protein SMC5_09020 [Candidatus Cryosericum odellii]
MEKPVDPRKSRDPRGWIGLALLAALGIIVAWKLATAQWRIDLTRFSFTDLLSLLLALFAVLMSALFYFKANETSNAFYDNTYHFSQSMAEILARIESGFGERLKRLDDEYTGIANRVNGGGQIQAVKEEVKSEEGAVKKAEQEHDRLLEDLMKKAKLQDNEKQSLAQQMREQERQLNDAKAQLSFLRRHLATVEPMDDATADPSESRGSAGFLNYASEHIVEPISADYILSASPVDIERRFDVIAPELPSAFTNDLRHRGWIDSHGRLTEEGFRWLHKLAARRS